MSSHRWRGRGVVAVGSDAKAAPSMREFPASIRPRVQTRRRPIRMKRGAKRVSQALNLGARVAHTRTWPPLAPRAAAAQRRSTGA